MNTSNFLILCLLATTLVAPTHAREIADLQDIQRETRIVSDVMRSALRDQLNGEVRVTSISAEYLARQGVHVSVTLNTPWLKINDGGETTFDFHGDVRMVEIPEMVSNILNDLQLNIPPYEPEALEDLKALREEQRELRRDSRELRSDLREKRRELVRADDSDKEEDLKNQIASLEKQLQTVEVQYNELTSEIDTTYDELKAPTVRAPATQVVKNPKEPLDVPLTVAQTACDYGALLKSLNSDEFLTISVRRSKTIEYFAFEMDHVRQCSRDNMRVDRLLALAYQYQN